MTDISLPESINQHRHLIHSKAHLLQVFVWWYVHSKGYQVKVQDKIRQAMDMIQDMDMHSTVSCFNEQHEFKLMVASSASDIKVYFEVRLGGHSSHPTNQVVLDFSTYTTDQYTVKNPTKIIERFDKAIEKVLKNK